MLAYEMSSSRMNAHHPPFCLPVSAVPVLPLPVPVSVLVSISILLVILLLWLVLLLFCAFVLVLLSCALCGLLLAAVGA